MIKTDPIINLNTSLKWVLLLCLYLTIGTITKKYFGYFNILLFVIFLLEKKSEYCLYLTIIWIFISKFLVGIRYLELSGINNQIEKVFLLILLFIHIRRNYTLSNSSFFSKILGLHIILFIICFISFLYNHYNFLRIIVSLNYFILFLIVIISIFENKVYINLFNLLLAIGIIQIPIAACQYYGIIKTPAIAIFIGHSTLILNQGLDDVACGTFGPMASADLSIFLTTLSLILIGSFLIEKKKVYLYWGFFYLLQYLVVDSKTALAISVLVFIMFINKTYGIKNAIEASFKLNNIWLIIIFSLIFTLGIKSYYNTSFGKKQNFSYVISYIKKSVAIVYNNLGDWGKIKGFSQVYKQQYKEGKLNNVLFGFGIDEYNRENRRFYLKERSSPKMKLFNYSNSFLNIDSSLIVLYADIGICGLMIVLIIYLSIYNFFSKVTFNCSFSNNIQTIIKPLLIGLLIFTFLSYTLNLNSHSLVGLWLIIALALKFDEQPA